MAKDPHDLLDAVGQHGLLARAVIKQAKTEVVLSHVSGLGEYEAPAWGIDLTDVHVTRVDGRVGRHEAGVHQHCGRILDGDVVTRNGIRVMSADPVGPRGDHSRRRRACTVRRQLSAARAVTRLKSSSAPGTRRWSAGRTPSRTDIVLRLADPRIESVAETRCYHLFWRCGLPAPEPQYEVRDVDGELIGRLDFAWPALGVWIEFDGNVKYEQPLKPGQSASDVVLAEKRREDRDPPAYGLALHSPRLGRSRAP